MPGQLPQRRIKLCHCGKVAVAKGLCDLHYQRRRRGDKDGPNAPKGISDQAFLNCIVDFVQDRGFPPTIRELAECVGLDSASAVLTRLRRLEDEGRISREPGRPRAIRIL